MNWADCKNILIIRADNMGDLIMTAPAIQAVKKTFRSKITVLASKAASLAAPLIPEIDELIVVELPWLKNDESIHPETFQTLAGTISQHQFDGCIIFTVYSQSSLPSAMLAWLCGIPKRLAYCRENPYQLLTDWVPDKEPYTLIRHQVKRDLMLVNAVCATSPEAEIQLKIPENAEDTLRKKLPFLDFNEPFILFHPGVSEPKRAYPQEKWVELIYETSRSFRIPVYITGSLQDVQFAKALEARSDHRAVSVAGIPDVPELAALIAKASLLVSVNTGPVHIAAGLKTPVVVLYAQTNPQHTPWKTPGIVFEFSIPREMKSKNEVIRYVDEKYYMVEKPLPHAKEIVMAMASLVRGFVAVAED